MGEDAEEKQINIDIMEENSEDIAKITDIMDYGVGRKSNATRLRSLK